MSRSKKDVHPPKVVEQFEVIGIYGEHFMLFDPQEETSGYYSLAYIKVPSDGAIPICGRNGIGPRNFFNTSSAVSSSSAAVPSNQDPEPFSLEAREYMRKRYVGSTVQIRRINRYYGEIFMVTSASSSSSSYSAPTSSLEQNWNGTKGSQEQPGGKNEIYAGNKATSTSSFVLSSSLQAENENIGVKLVSLGLASILGSGSSGGSDNVSGFPRSTPKDYILAEESAKKSKLGIHMKLFRPEEHIFRIKPQTNSFEYRLLCDHLVGTPSLKVWVEVCHSCCTFDMVICSSGQRLYVHLAGVQPPTRKGIPFERGKLTAQVSLLHRQMTVAVEEFDHHNLTLYVNMSLELYPVVPLVEEGLAEIDRPTLSFARKSTLLEAAQCHARDKELGIWHFKAHFNASSSSSFLLPHHLWDQQYFYAFVKAVDFQNTLTVCPLLEVIMPCSGRESRGERGRESRGEKDEAKDDDDDDDDDDENNEDPAEVSSLVFLQPKTNEAPSSRGFSVQVCFLALHPHEFTEHEEDARTKMQRLELGELAYQSREFLREMCIGRIVVIRPKYFIKGTVQAEVKLIQDTGVIVVPSLQAAEAIFFPSKSEQQTVDGVSHPSQSLQVRSIRNLVLVDFDDVPLSIDVALALVEAAVTLPAPLRFFPATFSIAPPLYLLDAFRDLQLLKGPPPSTVVPSEEGIANEDKKRQQDIIQQLLEGRLNPLQTRDVYRSLTNSKLLLQKYNVPMFYNCGIANNTSSSGQLIPIRAIIESVVSGNKFELHLLDYGLQFVVSLLGIQTPCCTDEGNVSSSYQHQDRRSPSKSGRQQAEQEEDWGEEAVDPQSLISKPIEILELVTNKVLHREVQVSLLGFPSSSGLGYGRLQPSQEMSAQGPPKGSVVVQEQGRGKPNAKRKGGGSTDPAWGGLHPNSERPKTAYDEEEKEDLCSTPLALIQLPTGADLSHVLLRNGYGVVRGVFSQIHDPGLRAIYLNAQVVAQQEGIGVWSGNQGKQSLNLLRELRQKETKMSLTVAEVNEDSSHSLPLWWKECMEISKPMQIKIIKVFLGEGKEEDEAGSGGAWGENEKHNNKSPYYSKDKNYHPEVSDGGKNEERDEDVSFAFVPFGISIPKSFQDQQKQIITEATSCEEIRDLNALNYKEWIAAFDKETQQWTRAEILDFPTDRKCRVRFIDTWKEDLLTCKEIGKPMTRQQKAILFNTPPLYAMGRHAFVSCHHHRGNMKKKSIVNWSLEFYNLHQHLVEAPFIVAVLEYFSSTCSSLERQQSQPSSTTTRASIGGNCPCFTLYDDIIASDDGMAFIPPLPMVDQSHRKMRQGRKSPQNSPKGGGGGTKNNQLDLLKLCNPCPFAAKLLMACPEEEVEVRLEAADFLGSMYLQVEKLCMVPRPLPFY